MAKEPNDNLDLEEEEGTEGEEADTSTDGEESAEGEGDDTTADTEGDEGGEEGDGTEGDGADEFVIPEKFKGKDATAIAKSYVELEKSIEKKAAAKAREMLGKNRPVVEKKGAEDDAIKEAMKGVDFSKMKPEEFAAWLIKTVETRAQEIARNTYDAADSTKQQVQTEINSVTKVWPALKENEGFRNMVLALIENKANKGDILTLKEACVQVGKAMGVKPGTKPVAGADGAEKGKEGAGEEKPKPKLGVERANGSAGGERETEEEKVLAGLMSGRAPGGLGGLY